MWQESLADAKVSAEQALCIEIYSKSMQGTSQNSIIGTDNYGLQYLNNWLNYVKIYLLTRTSSCIIIRKYALTYVKRTRWISRSPNSLMLPIDIRQSICDCLLMFNNKLGCITYHLRDIFDRNAIFVRCILIVEASVTINSIVKYNFRNRQTDLLWLKPTVSCCSTRWTLFCVSDCLPDSFTPRWSWSPELLQSFNKGFV